MIDLFKDLSRKELQTIAFRIGVSKSGTKYEITSRIKAKGIKKPFVIHKTKRFSSKQTLPIDYNVLYKKLWKELKNTGQTTKPLTKFVKLETFKLFKMDKKEILAFLEVMKRSNFGYINSLIDDAVITHKLNKKELIFLSKQSPK